MGQSGGGGGVTRAVCIRDISPAVKVNARQQREKEIGVGDTGTHTMLQSKATLLTAPYGAINGKSGDREGTAREREKKRRHHRGSVRVQKHTGMEEEGSISRPLFFFIIFFLSHGSLDTVIGCRVAFLGATWRRRRLLRFPARGRGGRGSGTRCRHR